MSFKAVQWAFDQVTTRTATDKAVLVCLAYHANSKGESWPGTQTIVEETLLSERTVRYSLSSLVELGVISVEHRHRKKGMVPTSNLCKLKMHRSGLHPMPHPPAPGAPPSGNPCPTILDPQSDPQSDPSEATDPTVVALDFSNWKVEVGEDLPSQSHPDSFMGISVKIVGAPLTPQMVSAGITGIAFTSQAELEEFGPALGVPVNLDDLVEMYKKILTPSQAVVKAKNGKKSYTSLGLKVLWQDLNIHQNPGVFQVPMTMKVQGQFGHLNKRLAGVDVGWLMHDTVLNWVGFGKFLKDQGVVQDFPDKPHPGFFLKHAELAVGFSKKQLDVGLGGMKPFDPDE